MKSTLAWLSFGMGFLLFAFVLVILASVIADNFRQRSEMPVKTPLSWLFRLPDFMGIGGFLTDPKTCLFGILGLALILIALGFHLRHLARIG